jgi:hypothetical protein
MPYLNKLTVITIFTYKTHAPPHPLAEWRETMYKIAFLLLTGAFLCLTAEAQYQRERAVEKSFELSNVFYNPFYLNPYGIRAFSLLPAGFIDDPIGNLNMNPSNLPDQAELPRYIYVDFRGDRHKPEVIQQYWGLRYTDWTMDARALSWYVDPRWYSQAREEPEPVFSMAIMGYPSPERLSNLFAGITYQFMYTDERYYNVPADIYRSQFGFMSDGLRVAGMESVPIIDRADGADHMNHQGHFVSGFIGWRASERFSFGVRGSVVSIEREGSQGRTRMMDDYNRPGQISQFQNWNDRSQNYLHYDVSGGLSLTVSEAMRLGAVFGWLHGDAGQSFDRTQWSLYGDGNPPTAPQFYYNMMDSETRQRWDHDGHTWYSSLASFHRVRENQGLILQVSVQQSNIDLRNSSSIRDTSYYASRYTYSTDSWSRHVSTSSLQDARIGTGTREFTRTQAMAAYHWQLSEKIKTEFGIVVTRHNTTVETVEHVLSETMRESESTGNWPRYHFYYRDEDLDLVWNLTSKRFDLSIPFIIHSQLSDRFELMVGINRQLRAWRIDDVTIAYIRFREHIENDIHQIDENFGETVQRAARNDIAFDDFGCFGTHAQPDASVRDSDVR